MFSRPPSESSHRCERGLDGRVQVSPPGRRARSQARTDHACAVSPVRVRSVAVDAVAHGPIANVSCVAGRGAVGRVVAAGVSGVGVACACCATSTQSRADLRLDAAWPVKARSNLTGPGKRSASGWLMQGARSQRRSAATGFAPVGPQVQRRIRVRSPLAFLERASPFSWIGMTVRGRARRHSSTASLAVMV